MQPKRKNLFETDGFYLLLIFLASVAIVSPVIFLGVPYGSADFTHHLQLANGFFHSIQNGVFYPNWIAEENFGYGAVVIRFYPPLMHYSLAICRILTGNWQLAIFAAFTFWSFIGGSGMYFWTKEIFSDRRQAAAAAVLFVLAPYHLNQFYNSFMFGEFAALSVIPFGFLFALRICRKEGKMTDVLGFAVSVAFLILSNLPQMVIGFICIGLYILCNLDKSKIVSQLSKFAAGGLLSLAASAFYWVRMLGEMNWINVAQPNTDPDYDYRNHFLLSDFTFDAHGIWFASLLLFITVFIVVLSLLVTKNLKSSWRDKELLKISILFIFSLFMLLPPSKFIWDNLEFLQKVQFPWRFLSILTVCASIFLGYCLRFVNAENLRKHRPLILIFAGIILIYSTFSVKQVALGAAFLEGSKFTEMVENSTSQKGLEHWIPVWAKQSAFDVKTKVSAGSRDVNIKVWEPELREISVGEGVEPVQARVGILYYPFWKAVVNGKPAEVKMSDDGAINLDLPAEKAEIKLFFEEPVGSLISRKISIGAWILILLLTAFNFFRKNNRFNLNR